MTMTRGSEINGGLFVGQTAKSSAWVWYPGCNGTFEAMCALFDRLYA
jgi:hypothetical protein